MRGQTTPPRAQQHGSFGAFPGEPASCPVSAGYTRLTLPQRLEQIFTLFAAGLSNGANPLLIKALVGSGSKSALSQARTQKRSKSAAGRIARSAGGKTANSKAEILALFPSPIGLGR